MKDSNLQKIRAAIFQQENYEHFERLLMEQEEFIPLYVKPVSRQCSRNMQGMSVFYTS